MLFTRVLKAHIGFGLTLRPSTAPDVSLVDAVRNLSFTQLQGLATATFPADVPCFVLDAYATALDSVLLA